MIVCAVGVIERARMARVVNILISFDIFLTGPPIAEDDRAGRHGLLALDGRGLSCCRRYRNRRSGLSLFDLSRIVRSDRGRVGDTLRLRDGLGHHGAGRLFAGLDTGGNLVDSLFGVLQVRRANRGQRAKVSQALGQIRHHQIAYEHRASDKRSSENNPSGPSSSRCNHPHPACSGIVRAPWLPARRCAELL